ncbi:hypothetical protein CULT_250006 [[Clostridium] ultunense Esp]|nr:hypothetical protein CULT_250006 [[Clostridium] ultunense Esp]
MVVMPKVNFHKLDNSKKEKIIDAAYTEFLEYKHNYKKASVKRISKAADISIGSFYEYFYDKDDLFLYLIKKIISKKHDHVFTENNTLKENFLRLAKISEDDSLLGNKERELLNILLYDNEDIKRKFYFNYAIDNLMELNTEKLYKDKEKGLIHDFIDLEFASFLFTTIEYNIIRYFQLKNITDHGERQKIAENFIELIFKGIYKNGNVK